MKKFACLLIAVLMFCALIPLGAISAFAENIDKRPVWIISHRCNSPATHVKAAVDAGINAIEVDIRYSFSQDSWVLNHDAIGCQWADKLSDLFAQPGLGDLLNINLCFAKVFGLVKTNFVFCHFHKNDILLRCFSSS